MVVAEVEPVGNFIGGAVSEPLLQAGILATVVAYIIHLDVWMGAAAISLFIPQMVFVPLMQHAMNRCTSAWVWLLRQIGGGLVTVDCHSAAIEAARIDRIFRIDMRRRH